MDAIKNRYSYKNRDLTFIVLLKIKHIVELIAKKSKKSFDSAYADFTLSSTYSALQNMKSLMWYENAEFIADEYFRENKISYNKAAKR
jgi:hypothetical protein